MDAAVRTMLIDNEPFNYAHMIKFERPSLPDSVTGKISTSAVRYTYITDGSRNISFDDGSTDLNGASNGTQVYLANKVLRVSSITEETEAKASTFTVELDGTALGASVSDVAVTTSVVSTGVYDIVFPATVDLTLEGFREGDKVNLQGSGAFVDGYYNIHSFRTGNTLRVTKIDSTMTAGSFTVSMTLASDEIVSILADKTAAGYASFLNRHVFIYKAFFDDAGDIIGAPILIFKGLITNNSFDDTENNIKVIWGLTSHWGDWAQVTGRLTSDDFHRALDENGNPNPDSAIKPLYAYDKGFSHAETSINLLAKYSVLVEKQTVKAKNGFFGIGSKVKVKKYLAPEERTSDLDFQLSAKNLPVHYGIRPVTGIPIFVDTLVSDPSTIYMAWALGEGEIGAIYDVYIDGNSLICNNESDADARSVQTSDNTVPLICKGRADRGDVLGGDIAGNTGSNSFYAGENYLQEFGYNLLEQFNYFDYVLPAEAAATQSGILDGETLVLSSPQSIALDFFSGKSAQKAARSLVTIAAAGGFKVQTDYWAGTDTAEYWGPNHRLLDTAYVVGKVKIAEGETTVPDLEFILKGKVIPCYNYDYSYSQYAEASGEDSDNFKLGAIVDLKNSSGGATLNANVQIIDKWTIINPDGTENVRFRFSATPALGYVDGVPSVTKFYMELVSDRTKDWTMVTYNHQENAGTVAAEISSAVNSVTNSSGSIRFDFTSNVNLTYGGDPTEPSPKYSIVTSAKEAITNEKFGTAILAGTETSTTLTTDLSYTTLGAYATAAVGGGNLIVSRNTIKLAAGASSVDDYYNGYTIVVTKYNSATGRQVIQTKKVLDYDGANRVATIDDVWDINAIPGTSDTYYLQQPYIDHRVSTNFAAITIDYATGIYGRNLTWGTDINRESALQAMRDCDERSNVTVRCSSVSVVPTAGAVYKFTNTAGDIIWQGTASTSYVSTVPGSSTTYVTFTDVIGKLTNYWKSWRTYAEGELVYYGNNLYKATGSYVANSTAPVHTSSTVNQLTYQGSLSLTKVSGTGDSSLALFVAGNPVQAVKNDRITSGYSLYDSDGVDYWKYLGWESYDQRWVTRHQGNISIDTSQPVFDNMNGLLAHYGGIFRYNAGQYHLAVEAIADTILDDDDEPYNITEDHIVGKIKINDEGIRGSYNSLAVSYADPSNKFESRTISFFNSDYLKADRNIPRKGNLSIPGVTNYYNARLLADRYLNKSRFGTSISLTISPRGLLLLPGRVAQLQYPRYGWVNKKFRIESVNIAEDCLVDIVAKEYDDSFYSASNIKKQAGIGVASLPIINTITAPSGLTATEFDDADANAATISLTWTNSSTANSANTFTEIYGYSNNINITSITSNVITTTAAHGLAVGNILVSFTTANGVTAGNVYYVKTVPTSTTITISGSLGGDTLALTNGSGLTIGLGLHTLITTVNCPGVEYKDIVYTTAQLDKYYRIRHKQAVKQNGGDVDQYSSYYPSTTAVLGSTIVDVTISPTGNIDLGTGDSSLHLSGSSTEILAHFGAASANDAPTKVTTDGTLISRDFEQRSADNTLKWSSATGHTQSGLNDIFANLANQLPTTSEMADSLLNASSVSGTTDPGAGKTVTYRLGATSDIVIEAVGSISGENVLDLFTDFTYAIYERYSSDGDFSGSTWSSVASTTIVRGTDYTVATAYVPAWTGDGYLEQEVYQVLPTSISVSTTSASKAAGYYQYAIVGPNATPWAYEAFSSLVKATDEDSVPSYILSGNGSDSVNFIHPLGSYSNLTGESISNIVSYTADMAVVRTSDGLPRTVINFNSYDLNFDLTAGTDLLTSATDHGLEVGQKVQATTNAAGFSILSGYYYWVKTVPTGNTLTLSATYGGSTLDITADDTDIQFKICINHVELGHTGIGALDTGTKANSTWYYIWLISNGIVDRLLASVSSTSPTMPTGYSYRKLIGACKTNASGNILDYIQRNDKVQFKGASGTYQGVTVIAGGLGSEAATNIDNNSWGGGTAYTVRANSGSGSFVPLLAHTATLTASARNNGLIQVAPNNSYDGYNGTIVCPLMAHQITSITMDMMLESNAVYVGYNNSVPRLYCAGFILSI